MVIKRSEVGDSNRRGLRPLNIFANVPIGGQILWPFRMSYSAVPDQTTIPGILATGL